jgi:hypothetical protein
VDEDEDGHGDDVDDDDDAPDDHNVSTLPDADPDPNEVVNAGAERMTKKTRGTLVLLDINATSAAR